MPEPIVTTVRLPPEVHQELRERVTADRSIQSQIIEAIAAYLKTQRD